ncbi:hypothetical protein VFPFJ_05761 [Purpureocillium lilacinum]|uniref:Uncharacterized protein n=1 Tax=Purpureocillium lilacinum TaxID=33203 RepID=A0A179HHF5_PURLI|nr:hypothetical protein VFPFJ_05761 [Purpureocillium lilacinum]KAK4092627.1 hypothetical protein Purlil1_3248 [Purpureocillium lilacinum]OAQ84806.1 hypothetical protein VFPBJ_03574 [Purpureocillium lilacinum]OAQ89352.1 hypothetical protein VFPFJ_05761 [Purpureocillium lilacinum]PWI74946.1 hypothetical protein PCL_08260 [Purpureocillium lilacinum]GJN69060.1 hypothetical protein PLICBS_003106 [Purpureocillium lilacinum]
MSEEGLLAQEIIVIALSVLVLVALLGFLITFNVTAGDLRPQRYRDTGQWVNSRKEAARVIDALQEESFIESVRRRSVTLAEDLKRELMSLKRKMSMSTPLLELEPRPEDLRVTNALQSFTLSPGLQMTPTKSGDTQDVVENRTRDSFALTTGRESLVAMERKRSTRSTSECASCDLEAQHDDDSSSP